MSARAFQSNPDAIPTTRDATVTVKVLKAMSSGDRNGKDTRDATKAATDPAIRPANIVPTYPLIIPEVIEVRCFRSGLPTP